MKIATDARLAYFLFAAALGFAMAPPAAGMCAGAVINYPYPIVMKGPKALRGQRTDSLAAFARSKDGTFHQVSLQIDEVNADGDFVLAGGIPYTKATDDGVFDDNDEAVVRGEELGEDFGFSDIPETVKARLLAPRALSKASFCRGTQQLGHLLLAVLKERPVVPDPAFGARWPGGDVGFDSKDGVIDAGVYTYKFDRGNPVLLGEVLLKQPPLPKMPGPRNANLPAPAAPEPERIIANSKFLMPLKTPFFLPDMTFKDSDFTSQIECWQTGPIRSIVAVGVKYSSFLSLFKLHLFSELVFYRAKFEIPTKIQFIFDPAHFLKPGSGLFYALSFPDGGAWDIQSNLAPMPRMSPEAAMRSGPKANATDVFTAQGHRFDGNGAFLVNVRVDAKARENVPPPYILRAPDLHDERLKEYWPWLGGADGDLGVYLDISQVKEGLYDFGLDLLLSAKANDSFTDYGFVDVDWQQR